MTAAEPLPGLYVPDLGPNPDALSAALSYAAAGWFVLPVRRGSKRPGSVVGEKWHLKSSRDPQVIADMWAGTNHGIALHVGRSGSVVIDMDHPEHAPADLIAALDDAPFQSTRPDQPGRGHALFLQPAGRVLGNSLGELGPKWGDIRGKNGVIIVAPTQHPEGGSYRWLRSGPLRPLPGWIAGMLPDAGQSGLAAVVDIRTGATTAAPDPFRLWTCDEAEVQRDLVLARLRATPGGHINTELNDAAMFLGHFAHSDGFWTTAQAAQWLLDAQRHAWIASGGADDSDYREALTTIRSGLEAGLRRPHTCIQLEAGQGPTVPAADGETAAGDSTDDEPERMTAEELARIEIGRMARVELVKRKARQLADRLEAEEDAAGRDYSGRYFDVDQLAHLPQPRPLIEDVLTRHTYSVLRGRDGSFKSFVALDWALCLATGRPWMGKRAEQVRVLWLAAEGAYGTRMRILAWQQARGILVPPEMFTLRAGAVNFFRGGAEFDDFLERTASGGYGFVVLDTLRRISGGADGNGSDMGIVVDRVQEVKEATADGAALAVAHTDKGDNDTRGASSIEDDADCVWHAKRDEDGGQQVTVRNTNFKDGPDGMARDLKARIIELAGLAKPDGRPETSLVMEKAVAMNKVTMPEAAQQQKVLTELRRLGQVGVGVTELSKMLDMPKSSTGYALAALLSDGLARKVGQQYMAVPQASDRGRESA